MGVSKIVEWDYPGDMGLAGPYDDHAVCADLTALPMGEHGTAVRIHISAHRKMFFETDLKEKCNRCESLTTSLFVRNLQEAEPDEDTYYRLCDTCAGADILIKELAG
jgi:hypothetical protein